MEVFPSVYIHLGGDEAGKASWRKCGLCRARADSLGLDSTDGLQDYLMARMGRFLAGHGRLVRVLGTLVNQIGHGYSPPFFLRLMAASASSRSFKSSMP